MVSSRKLPWKHVNESQIFQTSRCQGHRTDLGVLFPPGQSGSGSESSHSGHRTRTWKRLSSAPGGVSLCDSFVNFYVQPASIRGALQVTPGVKGHNAKVLFIPFRLDSADSSEFNLRRFC